ncbi:hypothetical protein D5018_02620 [Parashewanella curva]|uniref:Uncharacterized protein n=1 Tax=Parashewanella curva TaxID=2338552 RepID=A0A3L8Q2J7_9GAMM|nr:hypothetical protein [Parashewanella curva]RLV61168.1 hypothetical protein D5018_02620 [Parashewanella curva]
MAARAEVLSCVSPDSGAPIGYQSYAEGETNYFTLDTRRRYIAEQKCVDGETFLISEGINGGRHFNSSNSRERSPIFFRYNQKGKREHRRHLESLDRFHPSPSPEPFIVDEPSHSLPSEYVIQALSSLKKKVHSADLEIRFYPCVSEFLPTDFKVSQEIMRRYWEHFNLCSNVSILEHCMTISLMACFNNQRLVFSQSLPNNFLNDSGYIALAYNAEYPKRAFGSEQVFFNYIGLIRLLQDIRKREFATDAIIRFCNAHKKYPRLIKALLLELHVMGFPIETICPVAINVFIDALAIDDRWLNDIYQLTLVCESYSYEVMLNLYKTIGNHLKSKDIPDKCILHLLRFFDDTRFETQGNRLCFNKMLIKAWSRAITRDVTYIYRFQVDRFQTADERKQVVSLYTEWVKALVRLQDNEQQKEIVTKQLGLLEGVFDIVKKYVNEYANKYDGKEVAFRFSYIGLLGYSCLLHQVDHQLIRTRLSNFENEVLNFETFCKRPLAQFYANLSLNNPQYTWFSERYLDDLMKSGNVDDVRSALHTISILLKCESFTYKNFEPRVLWCVNRHDFAFFTPIIKEALNQKRYEVALNIFEKARGVGVINATPAYGVNSTDTFLSLYMDGKRFFKNGYRKVIPIELCYIALLWWVTKGVKSRGVTRISCIECIICFPYPPNSIVELKQLIKAHPLPKINYLRFHETESSVVLFWDSPIKVSGDDYYFY